MKAEYKLARWVELKHKGQVKKYTGEPYFNHLKAVAELARDNTVFGYEIGLCHDLLEDTETSGKELTTTLIKFGYMVKDAEYITACVVELTDVFTSRAYPQWSRAVRKEQEAVRMQNISPGAQTVKYADLIDNMKLVIQYAPEYVKPYLEKKNSLLEKMNKGDQFLRKMAFDTIKTHQ